MKRNTFKTMVSSSPIPSPRPSNAIPQENTKLFAAVNAHARKVVNEKFPHYVQGQMLPQFSRNEIVQGKLLGSGFFGDVYEVQDITLAEENEEQGVEYWKREIAKRKSNSKQQSKLEKLFCFHRKKPSEWEVRINDTIEIDDLDDELIPELPPPKDARTFMKHHCRRCANDKNVSENSDTKKKQGIKFPRLNMNSQKSQARYAIKVLRPEIFHDPTKLYYQGIMDLNSETRLLASLQDHPNICKLRATGLCWAADQDGTTTTFHQDYFIILDRLYQILDDRLLQWQKKLQRYHSLLGKCVLDVHAKQRKKLWMERLIAGYGLASALSHVHSKNMVHRDLKVENIGFDIRGDIKLFDFGLARELPKERSAGTRHKQTEEGNLDGQDGQDDLSYGSQKMKHDRRPNAYSTTWNMTGETGTPRYMAPEVALNQPYNASCDTYSFCILFWQMLMLKKPFELYSARALA
jgi:serine/threonine protein kinase